ncbi:peptidase [Lederbergia citrea]|uniref:Probable succinyl-diaminopimelate desuccinylase n=1 Tax=Lederbergia citrea TaxID=2833581 RepID=A0A942Z459_9BACI|nr:peptidase [Lederbergia citrea]MBS4203212.1 peptidase [Lederbergia citrea]MBS4222117.1 peptidase [Lederbergia citrea]
MIEAQKQIHLWLKENKEHGVRFLQRLVQENSVRGNENKAQAIIIEKCRELGLSLDIWEINRDQLKQHPFFFANREDFAGNPNVAAVLSGSGGGRSLLLNGHIDVVPEGNLSDWTMDPYSGNIKDGKLFGRGASDMKGGTVSLLLAIEALKKLGIRLKGDLIFQSVIEEESGGAGTLSAVIRGYKADGAIIPEPTDMKFFPKQQGSMWFRINIQGKAAHGGTRYHGVSAIDKAYEVIHVIKELEANRNKRITDPLYDGIPIPIPINIGKIYSGTWPSSVPDLAIIEGRMGVAPGEKMFNAEKELEGVLEQLKQSDRWFRDYPPSIEWFGARWHPAEVDLDNPLIETTSSVYKKVTGQLPIIEASPWGTDGGILTEWGDTPVLVFGPGAAEAAHHTDEYIDLQAIFVAAEVIALTAIEWCGLEGGPTSDPGND